MCRRRGGIGGGRPWRGSLAATSGSQRGVKGRRRDRRDAGGPRREDSQEVHGLIERRLRMDESGAEGCWRGEQPRPGAQIAYAHWGDRDLHAHRLDGMWRSVKSSPCTPRRSAACSLNTRIMVPSFRLLCQIGALAADTQPGPIASPPPKTLTPAPLPTTPSPSPGEGYPWGGLAVLPLLPMRGLGGDGRRGPG